MFLRLALKGAARSAPGARGEGWVPGDWVTAGWLGLGAGVSLAGVGAPAAIGEGLPPADLSLDLGREVPRGGAGWIGSACGVGLGEPGREDLEDSVAPDVLVLVEALEGAIALLVESQADVCLGDGGPNPVQVFGAGVLVA